MIGYLSSAGFEPILRPKIITVSVALALKRLYPEFLTWE